MIADFLLLISANIFAVALIVFYLVSALTSWNRLWRMSGSAVLAIATASHQLLVSYGCYQSDSVPIAFFYLTVFLTNLVFCLIPVAAVLVCLSLIVAILNFINRYTTVYIDLYRIPILGRFTLRFERLKLQEARRETARREAQDRKLHPWLYVKDHAHTNGTKASAAGAAAHSALKGTATSSTTVTTEATAATPSLAAPQHDLNDILQSATRILPKNTGLGGTGTIFSQTITPRKVADSNDAYTHAADILKFAGAEAPAYAAELDPERHESSVSADAAAPSFNAVAGSWANRSQNVGIKAMASTQPQYGIPIEVAGKIVAEPELHKLVPNTQVPYSSVQTLGSGALAAHRYTINTPNNSYDEFRVKWDELLEIDASGKIVRKRPQSRSAQNPLQSAQFTGTEGTVAHGQQDYEPNMVFMAPDGSPYPRALPSRSERDGTYTTADMAEEYVDSAFQIYLADEFPRPTLTELFHLKKKPNEEAVRTAISAATVAAKTDSSSAGIANDGSQMTFTVGVLQGKSATAEASASGPAASTSSPKKRYKWLASAPSRQTDSGASATSSAYSSAANAAAVRATVSSAAYSSTNYSSHNAAHTRAATYVGMSVWAAPQLQAQVANAAHYEEDPRHLAWRQGRSMLGDELQSDLTKTLWGSLDLSTVPALVMARSKRHERRLKDLFALHEREPEEAAADSVPVAPELTRISRWAQNRAQEAKSYSKDRILSQVLARSEASREHHAQALRERSAAAVNAVAAAAKSAALGSEGALGYRLSPAANSTHAEALAAAGDAGVTLNDGSIWLRSGGVSATGSATSYDPRCSAAFNANASAEESLVGGGEDGIVRFGGGELSSDSAKDDVQIYTTHKLKQIEDPSLKQYHVYLINKIVEWIQASCRYCGYFMCVIALIFALYNTSQIMILPETNNVTVNLNVPMSFDGMRIVQISNLNISPLFNRSKATELVMKIMQLKPDLIVFTGDISMGEPWIREETLKPLFMLNAPLGVYAVPGDRDYSMHFMQYLNMYEGNHFDLLLNEHRSILYMGTKMNIIGIADESAPLYGIFLPSFEQISVDPDSHLNIILTHSPRNVRNYQTSGYHSSDLILSGNAVTSQVSFLDEITSHINNGFLHGLYQLSPIAMLYVSGGTGIDPMLPIRYGNHAELTVITVHSTLSEHPSPESNVQPQLTVPERTITTNNQGRALFAQQ